MLWENKPGTRELEAGFEMEPPVHWNLARHPERQPGDLEKKKESAPETGTDHKQLTCTATPRAQALQSVPGPHATASQCFPPRKGPSSVWPRPLAALDLFPGTGNRTWHFWALGTDLQNQ